MFCLCDQVSDKKITEFSKRIMGMSKNFSEFVEIKIDSPNNVTYVNRV